MAVELSREKPLSVSILAIGGQGGGVLTSWLVRLAESQDWYAQSTSVPGVAQRTGATLYHIEMIPRSRKQPVLSLMPVPGQVDLVVAAEFSEIGRAVQRGLVTPDLTTLIGSTHRSLAIAEKSTPVSGEVDRNVITDVARKSAKTFHAADMAQLAEQNGSVISAVLFGAIAASGALPFERDAFEEAIRSAGIGVDASLKAFSAGFTVIETPPVEPAQPNEETVPLLVGTNSAERSSYEKSCERIVTDFPPSVRSILQTGLNRVVDFQDAQYGDAYLDQIKSLHTLDVKYGGTQYDHALTGELAKYLATAMSYYDVIRVADLKIRESRINRVRNDVSAPKDQIVKVTEYMHPRVTEICGLMPVSLGKKVEGSRALSNLVGKMFSGSKRVRTDTMFGFLTLFALSSLRGWRLKSLRHDTEMQHIERWLSRVKKTVSFNYELAVELVKCQRLVKGYSDTFERSQGKFIRVMAGIELVEVRGDAASWARRLREAALADADGDALEGALKTITSFTQSAQGVKAS